MAAGSLYNRAGKRLHFIQSVLEICSSLLPLRAPLPTGKRLFSPFSEVPMLQPGGAEVTASRV